MPIWVWIIVLVIAGVVALVRRLQERDALAARKFQLDAAAKARREGSGTAT